MVCALACAGNKLCPDGMVCKNFQDSGEVCI
jgi:hypothetical protein